MNIFNKSKFKGILVIVIVLSIGLLAYSQKDNIYNYSKVFPNKTDECVPYNVLVNKSNDNYSVTWTTKAKCSGLVKYGEFTDNLNYTGINNSKDLSSTSHDVVIDKKWEVAYFIIVSNNKLYGLGTSPIIIN